MAPSACISTDVFGGDVPPHEPRRCTTNFDAQASRGCVRKEDVRASARAQADSDDEGRARGIDDGLGEAWPDGLESGSAQLAQAKTPSKPLSVQVFSIVAKVHIKAPERQTIPATPTSPSQGLGHKGLGSSAWAQGLGHTGGVFGGRGRGGARAGRGRVGVGGGGRGGWACVRQWGSCGPFLEKGAHRGGARQVFPKSVFPPRVDDPPFFCLGEF